MSNRKPVWNQRTSRPAGEYEGHPTPPSITIEEGKRQGETWTNTRITLTLDKAPNVIQNLQIAYAKALEIQAELLVSLRDWFGGSLDRGSAFDARWC